MNLPEGFKTRLALIKFIGRRALIRRMNGDEQPIKEKHKKGKCWHRSAKVTQFKYVPREVRWTLDTTPEGHIVLEGFVLVPNSIVEQLALAEGPEVKMYTSGDIKFGFRMWNINTGREDMGGRALREHNIRIRQRKGCNGCSEV